MSEAIRLAEQFKHCADDCGRLARAVLAAAPSPDGKAEQAEAPNPLADHLRKQYEWAHIGWESCKQECTRLRDELEAALKAHRQAAQDEGLPVVAYGAFKRPGVYRASHDIQGLLHDVPHGAPVDELVRKKDAEAAMEAYADAREARPPMRERDIERHLVKRVKELGGEVRKVQWVGRRGAPDRLVMLPARWVLCADGASRVDWRKATTWVELKAPGEKPEPHQVREHERMRNMGQRVVVIDRIEQIEELLK